MKHFISLLRGALYEALDKVIVGDMNIARNRIVKELTGIKNGITEVTVIPPMRNI